MEKIGDEVRDISDEIPFDIPESWEWCRLNTICQLTDGENIAGKQYNNLDARYMRGKGEPKGLDSGKFVKKQTLLILVDGENSGEVFVAPEDGYMGSTFKVLWISPSVFSDYVLHFIEMHRMTLKHSKKGAAIPHLNKELFFNLSIPLPPLAEQHRIVAKIEELLPHIENYTEAETKLNALNTTFPTQLKKSILQQAVQGKLVPQNPDDEPASVLLERIRAEKQELIKAGKIKKDKNESVIFRRDNSHYEMMNGIERCIDDEIPFEVPESWEWSRLGSLVQVNPRNSIDDETDVGFIPMPLIKEGFSNSHSFETRKWKDIKSGFTHFADGDVVIAKITPCFQNRKSAIISELPNGYGAGTTELHVLRDNTKLLYTPYLLLICKTHDFIENGMKNFTGTAGQQRIGKDFVSNYLIPIPPYEEQRRIVEAIENLIPYCQKI